MSVPGTPSAPERCQEEGELQDLKIQSLQLEISNLQKEIEDLKKSLRIERKDHNLLKDSHAKYLKEDKRKDRGRRRYLRNLRNQNQ